MGQKDESMPWTKEEDEKWAAHQKQKIEKLNQSAAETKQANAKRLEKKLVQRGINRKAAEVVATHDAEEIRKLEEKLRGMDTNEPMSAEGIEGLADGTGAHAKLEDLTDEAEIIDEARN